MRLAKKLAAILFLLFLGLWVAGFCRTFSLETSDLPDLSPHISSSFSFSSAEYQGGMRIAHNLAQVDLGQTPLPKVLDQEDISQITVFAKTAQLSSGTTAYTDDENRTRKAIAVNKAVVFSEKATGIAPQRRLSLGIGVRPEHFDALLKALMEVGHLEAVDVQQQDRTTEFRKLHGQRLSLKKHHDAILKVRDTSKLSVEEALKMEQRIVEIEKEIQAVGVHLGDLLAKEPSYNLFLTLQEGQPGSRHDREFTFARRLGSGFVWAIGWWLLAALGVALVAGMVISVNTLRRQR